jgi:hypothetical protein
VRLVEGKDYYLEHGLYVFTERYHARRGYCCGSRCRHCPYPALVQAEAIRQRLAGEEITGGKRKEERGR